jgi:hypothetical protein
MPNPNELQRLHEEALHEERETIISSLKSGNLPRYFISRGGVPDKGTKALKEGMLRRLREIENELGIQSKPYNSTEF